MPCRLGRGRGKTHRPVARTLLPRRLHQERVRATNASAAAAGEIHPRQGRQGLDRHGRTGVRSHPHRRLADVQARDHAEGGPLPRHGARPDGQAQIANLLSGAPIGVLRLRDGTLNLPTATGSEAIKRIDARFDASSGTGTMSSFGSRVARRDRGLRARSRRCRRDRGRNSRSGQSHSSPRNLSRLRSRAPRPSTTVFSSRATYRPTWTTRGAS